LYFHIHLHSRLLHSFPTRRSSDLQLLYEALLGASPNDAALHHSLGRAYMKQRKFPQAQQEFVATLKLKPDFGEAYGDLAMAADRSEEHTSELQSRGHLVCRLLLEK